MKIGDIVQVKTWGDMVQEFGISDEGVIKGIAFAPHMKEVCGLQGTIRNSADAYVCLNIAGAPMDASHWVFAKESLTMVEEAPPMPKVQETNLDVLRREIQAGKEEKVKEMWAICNEDIYDCVELLAWLKAPADEDDLK